jgi:PKD repeat protein
MLKIAIYKAKDAALLPPAALDPWNHSPPCHGETLMSSPRSSKFRAALAAAIVTAGIVVVPVVAATSAAAAPAPIAQRTSDNVTTDLLPTVQVDGVVWSQVIIGNTVYVAGSFQNAISPSTDPVQTTTPRSNLLAYNLTTGALVTSFSVALNGQAIVITKSPDESRLYVGGDFTTANGTTHRRLVAITPAGQVIEAFKPNLDARVAAIAATNTTVYAGGNLSNANGSARSRLAAFTASTGGLLTWAPTANASVKTMLLTPDGSKLLMGGQFQTINGTNVYGLVAVSPTDGAIVPWAASGLVRAYGPNSAITALKTDGTAVYGTGYTFGALPVSGTREFEGTFSADINTGDLNWMADCHGDSYDVFSTGKIVYSVSHAHFCANVGGFPEVALGENRRALAFTPEATGTLNTNAQSGYKNWGDTPSPTMINWFPDLEVGTITGQSQAAWSVVGNDTFVSLAGEFPRVNNVVQRGIVRFATEPTAPGRDGPRDQGSNLVPAVRQNGDTSVKIRFQTSWDRDDTNLTYRMVRNPGNVTVYQPTTLASTWWNRPFVDFVDSGLTKGSSYTYRLYAVDTDGNQTQGDLAPITPGVFATAVYPSRVFTDGASAYYRLGEAAGSRSLTDAIGVGNGTVGTGVTRAAAGAIPGDPDGASNFSGTSSGIGATAQTTISSTDSYTLEGWVKTSSTSGGAVINFGTAASGSSGTQDRILYFDNSGRIAFGVNSGGFRVLTSPNVYRDGSWHHVAATLGSGGMALYVDGVRVANRTDVTTGLSLTGYWRIGGDRPNTWTGRPASGYLAGAIDEVAIYPTALSAQMIAAHAALGGTTPATPTAPSDRYGAAVFGDNPELYWRFAETSGTSAADAGTVGTNVGIYAGGVTLGATGAIAANSNQAAQFNGTDGVVFNQASSANPTTFSVEAWAKTSSRAGGRIIGFGDSQQGSSTQADRQLYFDDSGHVVFGLGTATLTSANTFNDGSWHHFVGVNGGGTMALYIDGVQVESRASGSPLNFTGYWRAGGDTTGGSSSPFLNGSIDEVAVYYTALSAAKVDSHYQVGIGTTPNTLPVASFTATPTNLNVAVNGTASTDADGSIASYSWSWGDNTPAGSGPTASHTYAAGTYTITLTVIDNRGGTNTSTRSVTVAAANTLPVASFATSVTGQQVSVNGSASTDADGSIASYSWNWGDGTALGTGATATHTYTAGGNFTITLTVTDNRTGNGTTTRTVAITAPNQAPVANFTNTNNGRVVSFNSTSTDAGGSIASYAWNWGDGTAVGTGATPSHTYAADGTYTVTLTVTDNQTATSTISRSIVVSGMTVIARDSFARSITGNWGIAEVGGTWTMTGGASKFAVNGQSAIVNLTAAASGPSASLNGVSVQNLDATIDFSTDKIANGAGVYTTVSTRKVGTSTYQFTLKFVVVNGVSTVTVGTSRVLNGTSTSLGVVTVPGLTYSLGDVIRMRYTAIGSGTTTLQAKAWKVGTTEPAAFNLTRTDNTAALQAAGPISVQVYLSGSATNFPIVASLDSFIVNAG